MARDRQRDSASIISARGEWVRVERYLKAWRLDIGFRGAA